MKNLRDRGTAVMTLTDVVDDFCLAQGNMRESNILAQYRHARWAYKDLFRTTFWFIKKAVLCVDCKDHSIRLPDDCESNKIIALSVVDKYGKLHPLGFNSDWNTAKIKCTKIKCSCNKCHGENTLCGAIDSIQSVITTVTINGTDYSKIALTRYDGSGAVQTQTTTPTWDVASQSVKDILEIKTVCNVEVTDHGCIKATRPNMDLLRENFGVGNFIDQWSKWGYAWGETNAYRELIPTTYNYWGEWNYNAADPQIVHIFGSHHQNHFNQNDSEERNWRGNIRQVILDYQTNGEIPNTEILVPEYAVNAIDVGIVYMQKQLNTRVSESDKLLAKRAFRAEKVDVHKYLNPIHAEVIAELQTNPRHW